MRKISRFVKTIHDWFSLQADVMDLLAGKDTPINITVSDVKTRSAQQNRYYWGVVVKTILDECLKAGKKTAKGRDPTANDIHNVLKRGFLKESDYMEFFGVAGEYMASTTRENTKEFEEYLLAIRAHFAQHGIDIPPPNEPPIEEYEGSCD